MAKLGKTGGNLVYLQVSGGNLVQRLDEHYQGDCIKRKLKMWKNAGKEVKELHYPNAEGFITNVEMKISDFGHQIAIVLDNEVSVQFASNDFISICNTLLNFGKASDLSKEIQISAYIGNDGYGKFSIWQSGQMLKWYVTKENSEKLGCPQATKKVVAGKTKWDFDDVNNWYFEKIGLWISENFPNGALPTRDEAVSDIDPKQALASVNVGDDMWEAQTQEVAHKDTEAPVQGYAPMPTGWTAQAQAQTGGTQKKQEEEISVEDLPF